MLQQNTNHKKLRSIQIDLFETLHQNSLLFVNIFILTKYKLRLLKRASYCFCDVKVKNLRFSVKNIYKFLSRTNLF